MILKYKRRTSIIAASLCISMLLSQINIPSTLQTNVYASTEKQIIDEWNWSEPEHPLHWSSEKERWEIDVPEDFSMEELETWLPDSIEASILNKKTETATPSVPKPEVATNSNAENLTDDEALIMDLEIIENANGTLEAEESGTQEIELQWNLNEAQTLMTEAFSMQKNISNDETATNSSAKNNYREITLYAELPFGYQIKNTVEPVEVTLVFAAGSRKISQEVLDANLIETVSPDNILINVFDYWITGEKDSDVVSKDEEYQTLNDGINKEHPMIFKYNMPNGIQLGYWNNWTRPTGGSQVGIVKNKLENGYPVLNLTAEAIEAIPELKNRGQKANESLDYLFAPDVEQEGKRTYKNITGLFRENGTYLEYDAYQNFSELVAEKNENSNGYFRVYNAPAVGGAGDDAKGAGQFFPFNDAQDVFVEQNGKILSDGNVNARTSYINHYFGLTMEVDFQQPDDGIIDNNGTEENMEWYFSGDDDVWVFIDDVLVADVGGIHDELYAKIDFATGKIIIDRVHNPNANTRIEKTLKQCFEEANMDTSAFNGDTFADRSNHTMKMFYLERGNNGSHMHLSFNLLNNNGHMIEKQDQDGNLISGAVFDLYAATANSNGTYTIDAANPDPLLEGLTANSAGSMEISSRYNDNFDFSQYDHYILKEVETPDGYRTTPDIWLDYRGDIAKEMDAFEKSSILTVANPFETGTSINHVIEIYQSDLTTLDFSTGVANGILETETISNGLLFAVPLVTDSTGTTIPLYGSTKEGFHPLNISGQQAVLAAILCQVYGSTNPDLQYPLWNLHWETAKSAFHEMLLGLPYEIERYDWQEDGTKELSLRLYFLDMSKMNGFRSGMTERERMKLLEDLLQKDLAGNTDPKEIMKVASQIANETLIQHDNAVKRLDMKTSSKSVYAKIEIPNAAQMLSVRKVNEKGQPLKGAEFGIFETYENADQEIDPLASGTTGTDGKLIFAPAAMKPGAAIHFKTAQDGTPVMWYLKELSAPEGYIRNEKIVPILITQDGVFADAGASDDGIKTMVSTGKLMATMRHYAADPTLNNTLSEITAVKLSKDSPDAVWHKSDDVSVSMSYTDHPRNNYVTDANEAYMYQTDIGYLALSIQQTESADAFSIMERTDLSAADLTRLLAPITMVEVTNVVDEAVLTVNKTINEAYAPFGNPYFLFKVTGDDGSVQYQGMELSQNQLQGSVQFIVPRGQTYTVEEVEVSRYELTNIVAVKNTTVFEKYAVADVTNADRAEVTFENKMLQYEKYNHVSNAVNVIGH